METARDTAGLVKALSYRFAKDPGDSMSVRASAAAALGRVADGAALEPLLGALANDISPLVRANAARSLGSIGDRRAVEALERALGDKSAGVCARAAEALGALKAEAAVPSLIKALESRGDTAREALAKALGQIGDLRAVEPLLGALADKTPLIAEASARALVQLGDPRAFEHILAFEYRHGRIPRRERELTHGLLQRLGAGAKPLLLAALRSGRHAVRLHAHDILTELRTSSPSSDWSLPGALSEEDEVFYLLAGRRLAELESLGPLGPAARDRLVRLLQACDEDGCFAAQALGSLGGSPAIPALLDALRRTRAPDAYHEAVAEALSTLARTGAGEALGAALESYTLQSLPSAGTVQHLAAIGPPAVSLLIQIVESPQTMGRSAIERTVEIRAAAARALGESGDRRGVNALLRLLAEPDVRLAPPGGRRARSLTMELKSAAIVALGKLGDERARDAIGEVAENAGLYPELYNDALEALRSLRLQSLTALAGAAFQGGLDYYPMGTHFPLRLAARFEPAPAGTKVTMPDSLGTLCEVPLAGTIVFYRDGSHPHAASSQGRPEVHLQALAEGSDRLLLIFSDDTNGRGTYGGGRYLFVKRPKPVETLILDFNFAENPPCVFSRAAVCPLPPPANKLPFTIEAGEKQWTGPAPAG